MNRTMNLKGFALICGLMLLAFLIVHTVFQKDVNAKKAQENAMRIKLTQLQEAHTNLNAQLNVVGTEDYIVSSAKEQYAYMNKNDIRFEFVNPEALYAYTTEELQVLMDEMAE